MAEKTTVVHELITYITTSVFYQLNISLPIIHTVLSRDTHMVCEMRFHFSDSSYYRKITAISYIHFKTIYTVLAITCTGIMHVRHFLMPNTELLLLGISCCSNFIHLFECMNTKDP